MANLVGLGVRAHSEGLKLEDVVLEGQKEILTPKHDLAGQGRPGRLTDVP